MVRFLFALLGLAVLAHPASAQIVNAQTGTSYTFDNTDCSKLVTFNNASAVAVTLPSAGGVSTSVSGYFRPPCSIQVVNNGAGTVTITPASGTIGGAGTLALAQGQSAVLVSDGTNYQLLPGKAAGGASGTAAITGGTVSGLSALSVASGTPIQVAGVNALSISTASVVPSIAMAPGAGASLPVGSQFIQAIGPYTFASVAGSTSESAGLGSGVGIMYTGNAMTAMGTSVCGGETVDGCVAMGSDAMRDVWEAGTQGESTVLGSGSYVDGAGTNPVNIVGAASMIGNQGTITFSSGSPHVGDVYTLTPATTNACGTVNCTTGTMTPVSYTVVSGDSTGTLLAQHLAAAWSGAGSTQFPPSSIDYVLGNGVHMSTVSVINVQWQQYDAVNHPLVLKGHFPGGWKLTWTVGCTGTCTVSATYAAPFSGGNIAILGSSVMGYFGASTATELALVGNNSFSNAATTVHDISGIGFQIAPNATTASFDFFGGPFSGQACITCQFEVFVGAYSGYQATGNASTLIGDKTVAGQSCVTSGSNIIEIGYGSCNPSPTANGGMSIGNIIYGTGNTATGPSVSTGSIGIGTIAPGARFDILGTGTSTELAFRVQNSTPTVLFSVADNNTITVAGVAAVSCAANTVLLTTFAVTDGIVTHC